MNTSNNDRLAFDRGTVRSIDAEGRMHIEVSNISKATVNPYYGHEIPGSEELGLDPQKIYMLLRDPAELEKAAPTFNNIQILLIHTPVSAADPKREMVVGSTGSDAAFHAPYLTNSLAIWDAEAIKGIESKDKCELSSAYRYAADMTPGTYEGQPYDGVMRNIKGNHVALVEVGRAGPDVVVGDSQLQPLKDCNMKNKALSGKATLAKGALLAAMPKLAADAKLDLNTILGSVTTANWKANKSAIIAAIKPKLAQDADIADIVTLLDKLDGEEPADPALDDAADPNAAPALDADPVEEILAMLKGKVSDEDLATVGAKMKALKLADKEAPAAAVATGAADAPAPTPGTPAAPAEKKEESIGKPAMDAAIAAAVKATETATIQRFRSISAAEEHVKPYVGKLAIACDSAEGVYRAALDTMGVNIAGIHPSAYRAILEAQPKPGDTPVRRIAADQGVPNDFATRFPDATRTI